MLIASACLTVFLVFVLAFLTLRAIADLAWRRKRDAASRVNAILAPVLAHKGGRPVAETSSTVRPLASNQ
jgi:hypothetical protein